MVLLFLWLTSVWASGVCCHYLSGTAHATASHPHLTLNLKALASPNIALIKPQSMVPASVALVTRTPSPSLLETCPFSTLKRLPSHVCIHISSTASGFDFLCPQRFSHCLLTGVRLSQLPLRESFIYEYQASVSSLHRRKCHKRSQVLLAQVRNSVRNSPKPPHSSRTSQLASVTC